MTESKGHIIKDYLEGQKESMSDFLKELAKMETPSTNSASQTQIFNFF